MQFGVVLIYVFTVRHCAGAVYAVVVCPSVCLSQVGVLSKWRIVPFDSPGTVVF